ncbi:MAG: class I SAM-dependent methyltransferase [Candidatus Accumulibacter sp. UW26]|jgi:SAM-dependent methyltransferase
MSHRHLFHVEGLPVFQNKMFPTCEAALSCPRGDMLLVQDSETGFIFNSAFDSTLLEYDAHYQNEQACSAAFRRHLEEIREVIDRRFSGKLLIEVGCGKGYFLEYLHDAGYDIIGVDPAYEGDNKRVTRACFEPELGLRADGIVLRHVLEHISNPFAFLSEIARANGGVGQIYIEVPCFDWICQRRAWFDIFYEHVNYFRIADFQRMFGKVLEIGHVFGGQYLYVVADLATLKRPVLSEQDVFDFPGDFLDDIDRVAAMARSGQAAIWGGASKGVIFALYMQRLDVPLDCVIDINPAKQNKFMPGTGLRISTPDAGMNMLNKGANIFVMNSNYLQEIIGLSNNRFNYIEVDRNAA